jgi:hypothetical protein
MAVQKNEKIKEKMIDYENKGILICLKVEKNNEIYKKNNISKPLAKS